MDEEESGGLQEPLLLDAREKQQHGKSIATAVFNLSKVIIGAGEEACSWQHPQRLHKYSSQMSCTVHHCSSNATAAAHPAACPV